jgi:hypothetical protein
MTTKLARVLLLALVAGRTERALSPVRSVGGDRAPGGSAF